MPGRAGLEAIERALSAAVRRQNWTRDPVAFCRERLLYEPVAKQAMILQSLARLAEDTGQGFVQVNSCNSYGKSSLSAAHALWVHETFDPSLVVVTAPTERQVNDVIFKEIRRLYRGDNAFPRTSRIEHHRSHVITGFTATSESSFQGMRESTTGVICDEHNGLEEFVFTAIRGMLMGAERRFWLSIGNPTDPSTAAFLEWERAKESGEFATFELSAFEHPNIALEILGEKPVIPSAVRLKSLIGNMERWGEFLDGETDGRSVEVTDIDLWDHRTYDLAEVPAGFLDRCRKAWPARYWRPTTPEAFARVLGVYPPQSAYSVFAEDSVLRAGQNHRPLSYGERVQIGCDVARYGGNQTSFHVKKGGCSLHHESFQGQNTTRTAEKLKDLCERFGPEHNQDPKTIICIIDETGVGGGVVDQAGGYHFQPFNGKWSAQDDVLYPNARSEGLFRLSDLFKDRKIDMKRLPRAFIEELRKQAMSVSYKLDGKNRRKVLDKDEAIKKLKRSPDDLDAVALAYSGCGTEWDPPIRAEAQRRGLYEARSADKRAPTGERKSSANPWGSSM
jgi:phage terminase large subunit